MAGRALLKKTPPLRSVRKGGEWMRALFEEFPASARTSPLWRRHDPGQTRPCHGEVWPETLAAQTSYAGLSRPGQPLHKPCWQVLTPSCRAWKDALQSLARGSSAEEGVQPPPPPEGVLAIPLFISAVNGGESRCSRGVQARWIWSPPCFRELFVDRRHKWSWTLTGGRLTMSLQEPLIEEAGGRLFWGWPCET